MIEHYLELLKLTDDYYVPKEVLHYIDKSIMYTPYLQTSL